VLLQEAWDRNLLPIQPRNLLSTARESDILLRLENKLYTEVIRDYALVELLIGLFTRNQDTLKSSLASLRKGHQLALPYLDEKPKIEKVTKEKRTEIQKELKAIRAKMNQRAKEVKKS
jgi:hypothetical protein